MVVGQKDSAWGIPGKPCPTLRAAEPVRMTGVRHEGEGVPPAHERFDVRAVGAVIGGTLAASGVVLVVAPDALYLVLLALYEIPCELVNLPLEPALLFVAKHHSPLAVTISTTLGCLIGGVLDYWLWGPLLNLRSVRGAYDGKRWYTTAARWFSAAPFAALFLAALTPVPFVVFKLFAIAAGYPLGRYLVALTLARIPRFYLLAWFGTAVPIPDWVLAVAMVVLVAALLWAHLRDRSRRAAEAV